MGQYDIFSLAVMSEGDKEHKVKDKRTGKEGSTVTGLLQRQYRPRHDREEFNLTSGLARSSLQSKVYSREHIHRKSRESN